MFRCKVCGWIHEGLTPPNECPSCGAPADRFRPMDPAEIGVTAGELASYGIVGQGLDHDVEDTRRIRLLAFVDASFFSPYTERAGKRYPIYSGDAQWFSDNIPCMTACPSHTDISRYIALIADGRYADSYELNREHNVFPGCLGRMCARPCEDACRRKEVDAPIGICYLKRVAADYRGETRRESPPPPNGMTAAVIGAGVNGLTVARQLARKGYKVTIFERYPVPGGVMWAGVPEWRLPRDVIMEEVEQITDLGIEIRYNTEIGKDISFKDLVDTYDAVVISAGCQIAQSLGVPGEDLDGVVSGLKFLEDVNLGEHDVWVGNQVVTVGGGFTSMDCVRTVLRMGSERSVMTYRRSIQEIPVDELELEEAEIEGVEIMYMVAPTRVIGNDQGKVIGLELVRNELGKPDNKGRRRPEPVAGSEFVIPCDMVLVAIGQRQDNSFLGDMLPNRDRRGVPFLDQNLRTELPNVWAAGDYVINPTNFISSIGEGKRVALTIDTQLRGVQPLVKDMEITRVPTEYIATPNPLVAEGIAEWSLTAMSRRLVWGDDYAGVGRQVMPALPVPVRGIGSLDTTLEVEVGHTKPIGFEEAKRCLQCQLNIFIDGNRCILCNGCVDACPHRCIEMISPDRIYAIDNDVELAEMARAELGPFAAAMVIDERSCIRCGICVDWCPTECLTMDHFRLTPPDARESVDLAIVADG
ncbi:MAG: glutamate synthase small chain [Thermomicrobiales bacterium]|nr:glutamate synthase small chain [Thermomicrobiales bacterium]MEA2528173.1 glutamate synthase small chain [Thermomicrobiales bacterium]